MHRLLTLVLLFAGGVLAAGSAAAADRPNILWIISEDNGPQLGAYGDVYAETPNIDKLAFDGLRYNHCWSNAPVCAPARTTLFSSMFATSTGAEHMRSLVELPEGMNFFPYYLREAGYFTANWRKEDFNLQTQGQLWDVQNKPRPWAERKDQPFFAVFNIQTSHESQLRKRPHTLKHDPAKAPLPAYHPDTPEVRHDWAQYYDKMTEMDQEVGDILKRLEEDGLKEETIIFYFGDHGSGMPRSKRWPFDSGLHVPLVIRIPAKFKQLRPEDYQAGGSSERLVSFVDFGPTALSLAGIQAPEAFQGQAFLGEHAGKANQFLHGYRGRMDERIDSVRSVTDGRYVYVKHYMPHRIYGQHVGYMFQTPTTQVWKRLHEEGKLNEAQSQFWKEKPAEELFDLNTDPSEVRNLAGSADHADVLKKLRKEQRAQVLRIRDVGLLPEAEMHARCQEHGVTPYELGHNESLYPLERILETAELASSREESARSELIVRLQDQDAAVRYWAVVGLLVQGETAYDQAGQQVTKLLSDPSASVRIVTAELMGRYGNDRQQKTAVNQLLADANPRKTSEYAATAALISIDELRSLHPELLEGHMEEIRSMPTPDPKTVNPRAKEYPNRLKATLLDEPSGDE